MKLRQLCVVAVIAAVVPFGACKGTPKVPPKPPEPPAAPATPPPAPVPDAEPTQPVDDYGRIKAMASDEIDRLGLFADIHFDYDEATLRDSDRELLNKNAEVLKKFDFIKITIEGHCDERGSVEYNLVLSERRAKAAFDYLVSLGVPGDRLKNVAYGKEIPLCQDSNEECWARNRRDHFAVTGKIQ
jgi:peptidoglycan-associated lipoprotein